MEEKILELTPEETAEMKEVREKVYEAAIGYVEADLQKSKFGRAYMDSQKEFHELITGKIKMSGNKTTTQKFRPELDNNRIVLNPKEENQPDSPEQPRE